MALSLVLTAGTLIGVPAVTIVAAPQTAHATVASGDIVFEQRQSGPPNYPSQIMRRSSSGAFTNLSNTAYPLDDHSPDVSPTGAQIVYTGVRPLADNPNVDDSVLMEMNSDGSGAMQLHTSTSSNVFEDSVPRWSPSGRQVAYIHQVGNASDVWKLDLTTSTDTQLTSLGSAYDVSWSPDGTKLAYDATNPATGRSQLYIMNADGSSSHLVAGSDSGYNDMAPTWSPDGNRIYFSAPAPGVWYYGSTNGFTSGTAARNQLSTSGPDGGEQVRISADGSMLTYSAIGGAGCNQIWTIASTGGTPTLVTNTGCNDQNWSPTFVTATWPPAPPSNANVTIGAPSSHDAYGTRAITIGLSATGNKQYDYGWSTSSTTAPSTSDLQHSTNMTARTGVLNYMGVLNTGGTAYVAGSGTQPDQDWYLWIRSVKTNGTANAWNNGGVPLKVHTPKAGIWVAVGDSYSSGHHQISDQPLCVMPLCSPTDFTPNDPAFSWVTGAASNFNTTLHLPTIWQITPNVIARSGTPTSAFGTSGATPGSAAWASQGEAGQMSVALYDRYTSWNIVSMTGGANDTNWTDVMATWYGNHAGDAYGPWAVPTANTILDCPDTESVWQDLQSNGLNGTITSNLQGIVTVAKNASPGVRVVDLDYSYPVDYGTQTLGNPCYSDSVINGTTYHGAESVIDALHNDHAAVSGTDVKHGDLRSAFGVTSAVSNGYIQLTRLYGYPHPSSTGQAVIASTAASIADGTGW